MKNALLLLDTKNEYSVVLVVKMDKRVNHNIDF